MADTYEAFAMEIAGRAGGLIPTSRLALRDIVLYGTHTVSELADPTLERDPKLAEELFGLHTRHPEDIYIIASNSGVNGSIVGVAEQVKAHGHKLIVVTSLDHTMKVTSKHPSGKRLMDFADVTIDNLAPYGDSTLTLESGLVIDEIAPITSPDSNVSVESPYGARLSMVTSAKSMRRLPDGCFEVTFIVWSRLVTTMSLWPCAFTCSATPTMEPLTPEFDAMM